MFARITATVSSVNSTILCALAILAMLSFSSAVHAQPSRWYVDDSATGSNNGQSWTNAFIDLQDALSAADESEGSDEIWVAAGTYYPDGGTDDTSYSFYLLNDTRLYAGFAGTETSLGQRNPEKNITILSGDIGDPGETDDNSEHVVRAAAGIDNTAVLNGFTITRGNSPVNEFGSGMWIEEAYPKVVRCTFLNNGTFSQGFGGRGGGLAVIGHVEQKGADVVVVNCSFLGNRAGNHGGGVMLDEGGTVRFDGCVFSGNALSENGSHGGAMVNAGTAIYLTNCTFYGNDGTQAGGAIALESTALLINCIVWGNVPDQFQVVVDPDFVYINSSDVEGGWAGNGSDNIDDDPLFCDALGPDDEVGTADDNLRIEDNSPCIDVGDTEIVTLDDVGDVDDDDDTEETLPWDRDNEKPFTQWGRSFDVVNGPEAPPTKIDMGAYENQHIADCLWDIASSGTPGPPPDGDVGTPDLLKLLADWGACPGCGADFDCNLEVGNLDYAALMTNWGECPGGESAQGGDSGLEDAVWALGFEDVASYIAWLEEEASDEDGFTSAAALAALLSE